RVAAIAYPTSGLRAAGMGRRSFIPVRWLPTVYIEGTLALFPMAVQRQVPPGQREVRKWPRLDLGIVPRFDPKEWDLRVDGAVDRPLRFTYPEFLALPKTTVNSPFHCVTGWTTFDNEWVGVTIRALAEQAQVRPAAKFATF